jgi:hypothetical protein
MVLQYRGSGKSQEPYNKEKKPNSERGQGHN